jgi:hypothetical protein
VEIITGNNVGKRVFIPCIIMSPSEIDWTFVLCRHQFPVRVAFAMTVKKSQGQTLNTSRIVMSPSGLIGHLFCVVVNSYSSGICDDNQQESRSNTKQCWGIFAIIGLLPWLVVCCYLTGHKQCKHQNFQRPGS